MRDRYRRCFAIASLQVAELGGGLALHALEVPDREIARVVDDGGEQRRGGGLLERLGSRTRVAHDRRLVRKPHATRRCELLRAERWSRGRGSGRSAERPPTRRRSPALCTHGRHARSRRLVRWTHSADLLHGRCGAAWRGAERSEPGRAVVLDGVHAPRRAWACGRDLREGLLPLGLDEPRASSRAARAAGARSPRPRTAGGPTRIANGRHDTPTQIP